MITERERNIIATWVIAGVFGKSKVNTSQPTNADELTTAQFAHELGIGICRQMCQIAERNQLPDRIDIVLIERRDNHGPTP